MAIDSHFSSAFVNLKAAENSIFHAGLGHAESGITGVPSLGGVQKLRVSGALSPLINRNY